MKILINDSEGIPIFIGNTAEIIGGELKGKKGIILFSSLFIKKELNDEEKQYVFVGIKLDKNTIAIVSVDLIKQDRTKDKDKLLINEDIVEFKGTYIEEHKKRNKKSKQIKNWNKKNFWD